MVPRRSDIECTRRARADAALLERYGWSGDAGARDAIVERSMPLASALAGRRARDPASLAALTQIAALGLIKAVERYDASCGRPFDACAVPTITRELDVCLDHRALRLRISPELVKRAWHVDGAVRRLSRRNGRPPSVADVATELGGLDEADVLEALHVRRAATVSSAPLHDAADDDRIGAGDEIERAEQRVLLDGLMRVLGPAERVVVRLRVVDGMTGAQIAAAVGLTEIQVSRVVRRALARMHDAATAQEIVHA